MKIYAKAGIKLSKATRQAWEDAGVEFVSVLPVDGIFINLGDSTIEEAGYNSGEVVRMLLTPYNTRQSRIAHLLPPRARWQEQAWIKGQGRHDKNKRYTASLSINDFLRYRNKPPYDVQRHIEGSEYRVITVGDKAVQASSMTREGGERVYSWLSVHDLPSEVLIIAKQAGALTGQRSIVGWDIVYNGRAYILEGNTCMGVNEQTARAIVKQIMTG